MKRILRSTTFHKRQKALLDLNKEPCENKGFISDSDSSVDCVSVEGNMGEVRSVSLPLERGKDAASVDVCLPADGLGNGQKREEGNSVDGPENGEAVHAKVFEAKCDLANSSPPKEGMCESHPLGCDRDISAVVNENITPMNGVSPGKGRRGRKRKMVAISSSEGAGGKDAVKETGHPSHVQTRIDENSGSGGCPNVVKTENMGESIVEEINEDADKGGDLVTNTTGDASGDTNKDTQDVRIIRRGRKRKIMESVGDKKDDTVVGKKVENLALDGKPQVVGRLLRSRTMATTDGEKQAYGKENVGYGSIKVKQEIAASEKKDIKIETYGRAQNGQNASKVLKRRRGRPPKLHAETGNSKVMVNKKVKLGFQKKVRLPKAGYGAKDSLDTGSPELLDHQGVMTRKDTDKIHNNNKKEGDLGRREEQQLVRDEIVSLIKKVGWRIDYRPRMGRDYNDAVYVDWDGKTYWSVTLAYRSLKEKVENGTADVRAISLFTPISEDKLSTLSRVRKEKIVKHQKKQKVGSKNGKQVTKEKHKKYALKCRVVSECNQNLHSRPRPREVSSRKKTKRDSCEQGRSMVAPCKGRPRSNSLMARGCENGLDTEGDGFVCYEGKHNLLSWMIDLGTIPLGMNVMYVNQRRKDMKLAGKIDRDGICCGCCDKILTLSDFESHAGSTLGQPFNNIYLESGHSLLQCLRDSWSKQRESEDISFHLVDVNNGDPNDDTCNICGDGGDLICCDGCPSTFHQGCLQIPKLPAGEWHCIYCSCKFCGMVGENSCQGDDLHDLDDSTLFTCLLCEEKFHLSCIIGNGAPHVNCGDHSFCGKGCQKLFERLQMFLGLRHELEGGFSWTIIRHQDVKEDTSCSSDSAKFECNSKLALAFSVMNECFLPIIDMRSKTSMIQSVIYSCGSNFRRLNYSGFYTCILEKGDELVSAAAIRIHGNQLAEMPFIATRFMYRRQGMCRRLLHAIEMVLSSLEVEALVIPAISELNETWTEVFGFLPLEESMRQEVKHMSLIVFPGIDMLQKPLYRPQFHPGEITTGAGTILSQPAIKDGNANSDPDSDASGVKLQSDAESTLPVGSGAKGHSESLKNEPESTNASHLPEGTTSVNAQSGPATVFPCTENSTCCFNFDQVSECQVENYSLMDSSKGTLELNYMEKVNYVPEDGEDAIRYQNQKGNVIDISHTPHYNNTSQKEVHKGSAQSGDATGFPCRENSKCCFNLNQVSACQLESNSLTSCNVEAVKLNNMEKNYYVPEDEEEALQYQNKKGNPIDILDAPGCDTSSKKENYEPGFLIHEARAKSLVGVSLSDDSHLSSKEVEDCSTADYLGNANLGDRDSLCNLSTHCDATCLTPSGDTSTHTVPEVVRVDS